MVLFRTLFGLSAFGQQVGGDPSFLPSPTHTSLLVAVPCTARGIAMGNRFTYETDYALETNNEVIVWRVIAKYK